jgi:sarcosine oxidase
MRHCEIAILGLGLMGSAALHTLARRGVDVLGFDPLVIGEPRGSSHGSCRIYRRFNFENPAYTALSDQAWRGWHALESTTGRSLLIPSPVLEAGPPGSPMIAASRAAAAQAGAAAGPTTGAQANALFPAFNLPEDWDVALQQTGGILLAEAAMHAFREGLDHHIIHERAQFTPTPRGIRIATATHEVIAEKIILAAGPWIAGLVDGLAAHVSVTRQTVGWFKPANPRLVRLGALPIFLIEGPRGLVYGFPDFEGRGVKAAQHDLGPVTDADDWNHPAGDVELATTSATLGEFIPAAAGPIVQRDTCLYTNTLVADASPDHGNEFIIDRLPSDPRIIVASPCSGHGAKFATAIGEMLAELALDPDFASPAAFRLARFSGFGNRKKASSFLKKRTKKLLSIKSRLD